MATPSQSSEPPETDSTLDTNDFIWSFFMHSAPAVREWLFNSDAATTDEIIEALTNRPTLQGMDFSGAKSARPLKPVRFPDIGDLTTAVTTVDDTILGISFGFQGITPIIPAVYNVTKNELFRDARYVVRRTARKRITIGPLECFMQIELSWLYSGVLLVHTCLCGIRDYSNCPCCPRPAHSRNIGPVVDQGEAHVYLPSAAEKLKRHDHTVNAQNEELMNPKWFLRYKIREPEYFNNPDLLSFCLENANSCHTLRELVRFKTPPSLLPLSFPQFLGRQLAFASREKLTLRTDKIQSWMIYQAMNTQARQHGTIHITLLGKVPNAGTGTEVIVPFNDVMVSYCFLISHHGFSVHGRIQRLFKQLGIHYSKPELDHMLLILHEHESAQNPEPKIPPDKMILPQPTVHFTNVENDYNLECGIGTEVNTKSLQTGEGHSQPTGEWLEDFIDITEPLPRARDSHSFTSLLSIAEPKFMSPKPYQRRDGVKDAASAFPHSGRAINLSAVPPAIRRPGQTITKRRRAHTVSVERGILLDLDELDSNSDDTQPSPRDTRTNSEATDSGAGPGDKKSADSSGGTEEGGEQGDCKEALIDGRKVTVEGREAWECGQCRIIIRGKRGNLKRHILVKHYKHRNFACTYPGCSRKFQNKVNLHRHFQSVHTGRPFQCPQCTRAFKRQEDLDGHIRNSHGDNKQPFECEVCGSCFDIRGTLNRHKRAVHGMTIK